MAQEWVYDLFISYDEADEQWVEGYLVDALEKAEIRYMSESAFTLGVPRIDEFDRAIQQSRYTLLVISHAYLADDLRRFTDILAQSYGEEVGTWPVIPLTLQEDLQLPPRLKMLEGLKAHTFEQSESALERLCRQLKHPLLPPSPKPACPYPGMLPFREHDEQRFFGRDDEIEELLGRLRSQNFLTAIGPSGSGKSSLIFAGLIPKLKQSGLFGTGQWCIRSLRPGTSPLANLEAVLGGDFTALEVRVQQLLSTQPDARRLLLVVDQFEELFTQGGIAADSFQQILLKLVEIPNVYLILTVRADFYADLMGSLLWEKIRSHRFEVLPLDEKGLRQAIVRPAEGVEVYVDSALVERLLVDAKGEPGVLPLIQETLVHLWEKLERRFLPLKAYELLVLPHSAYGATPNRSRTGLQVAIGRNADAALGDLATTEKQAMACRIFLRLIQFGEGRADTRRQQLEDDLRSVEDNSQQFDETLARLAHQTRRLLTFSGEEVDRKRKVDIAHEALLLGWPTLQQWISELRAAEKTRRLLQGKAQEWVRLEQKGGFLDEVELPEAENWLSSNEAKVLGYDKSLSDLIKISRAAIDSKKRQKQRLVITAFLVLGGFTTAISFLLGRTNLQRINASLDAKSYSAAALMTVNKDFDALLEALKAGKELNKTSGVDPGIQTKVIVTLQQALNEVREFNSLERYNDGVNSVSFIEDMSQIASSSDNGTISIWNLQGKILKEWKVPGKKPVNTIISFNPVHKMIASASNEYDPNNNKGPIQGTFEGFITFWDLNRTNKKTWKGHSDKISSLSFISNGTAVASASSDKTIKIWGLDGKFIRELKHQDSINSFSLNGQILVSSSSDGYMTIWNINGDKPQKTWKASDKFYPINSVSFRPNGQTIVSGGSDTTVKLWNLDGSPLKTLGKHQDAVKNVSFSHDGQIIASTSLDGIIKLWKADGTFLMSLQGHSDEVNSVSFSSDNRILASASTDNTVKLWNLRGNPQKILSHHDGVNSVNFSPDKQKIISVGDRGSIKLWKRDGSPLKTLAEQGEEINSVSFSPDSKKVVVAGIDRNIKIWDIDGGSCSTINGHDKVIKSVSFSPNGKQIASASEDRTIKLSSIDGSFPKTLGEHTNTVNSVSFSPNGELLASASDDGTIKLWNTNDDKLIKSLVGHTDGVNSISFSPDSKLLVSAGKDSTVRLWNLNGEVIKTFKGHDKSVNMAIFGPDGKVVVSGSEDRTVRFWSIDDGSEITTLQGHQSEVRSVSFSPDGNILASADKNGKIILWNLDLKDLIRQSCSWLSDYLRTNPNSKNDQSLCKDN